MKKNIILLSIVAITFAFMFTSCDKDKNKEEPNKAVAIDIDKLPVYYNGVKMNCLLENFIKPAHRNGDMEDISLVFADAIHIFDVDAAFYAFCDERQTLEMYESSLKLDSIYAKAVELGLTELDMEFEIDNLPTEMYDYWVQVFNAPPPPPTRVLGVTLYDQQSLKGSQYSFFNMFWPSFGNFNDKARSIKWAGLGTGWLCNKTWFGKPRMWYAVIGSGDWHTLPSGHDKQFRSCFGL